MTIKHMSFTLAPTSVANAEVKETKLISTINKANVITPPNSPIINRSGIAVGPNVPSVNQPTVADSMNKEQTNVTTTPEGAVNKINVGTDAFCFCDTY